MFTLGQQPKPIRLFKGYVVTPLSSTNNDAIAAVANTHLAFVQTPFRTKTLLGANWWPLFLEIPMCLTPSARLALVRHSYPHEPLSIPSRLVI